MQAQPASRFSNLLQFPNAFGNTSIPAAPEGKQQPTDAPLPVWTDRVLHDARNALTSIFLLSGLLREPGVVRATHTQYVDDLEQVTTLLASLLRGGPNPAPAKPERAATATAAVRQTQRLLQAAAGPTVAVHVSAENGLPSLQMEDDALSRVLLNLVKNAAEAMPGGGTVHVTARRALSRTSPGVLIHVSDNGPGIPGHALPRIFEEGWSSKPQSGGEPRGLGLAIVRTLVRDAGGEVRVASTRRRGTTFELHLPATTN